MLIIGVTVKLSEVEDIGIKDYWVNFIIQSHDGQYSNKSIIKSICFHDELSIGDPVCQNGSRSKQFLQDVKSFMIEGVEIPRNVFLGKIDEKDNI